MSNNPIIQTSEIGHNIYAGANSNISIGNINIGLNDFCNDYENVILDIYNLIISNKLEQVKISLETIQKCDFLGYFEKNILKILEYKICLVKGKLDEINNDFFTTLLNDSQLSVTLKNLVKSVQIHYKLSKSENNARETYLKSEYYSGYTRAVYLQYLASEKDFNLFVQKENIDDLLEYEHYALIQCSIRLNKSEFAKIFAEKFKEKYPTENANIILALTQTICLLHETKFVHYWILDREEYFKLQKLIDKCISLSNKIEDKRIIKMSVILFALKRGEDKQLEKLANMNQYSFQKYSSEMNIDLIKKSPENINININWLNNRKTLNEEEFNQICNAIFYSEISINELNNWKDRGGQLSLPPEKQDIYEFYLMIFKLISLLEVPNLEEEDKLFSLLDELYNSYLKFWGGLNIKTINFFAFLLNKLEYSNYAQKFLQPLIPKKPWLSPVVFRFLATLLYCGQLKKFETYFSQLQENNTDYYYLYLKILKSVKLDSYEEIGKNVEYALEKFPDSISLWNIYIDNIFNMNLDVKETTAIIKTIPKSLYSDFNKNTLKFVNYVAKLDTGFAKSIFLEWFINDPYKLAVPLYNFNINLILFPNSTSFIYPSLRCSAAFKYEMGNQTYIKLIVDNCSANEYLLNAGSDFANKLMKVEINQEFEFDFNTYKVLEKMDPYLAASEISNIIRNKISNYQDGIFQIKVEDSPEGFNKFIEQFLSNNTVMNDKKLNTYSLSLNIELNRNKLIKNTIWNAYSLLLNKEHNKHLIFYNKGFDKINKIVIDILSVVYFAVTGLCYGLFRTGIKVFITKETQSELQQWIEKNYRKSIYLSDEENNRLSENLNYFLNSSELLNPKIFDMPDSLSGLHHFTDSSHYSSVETSISNFVPLFCLDYFLCATYETLDIPLANVNLLISESLKHTPMTMRFHAIYLAKYNLNAFLMVDDIYYLCQNNDEKLKYAVILIKNFHNIFDVNKLTFLTYCCVCSIKNALLQLTVTQYIEDIIYTCCNIAINELVYKSREERIAQLIYSVFLELNHQERQFVGVYFDRFIFGHFLNIKGIEQCVKKINGNQSKL
ncbi:hypothetical protein [Snodgrassella alvi]|uniref:hypothetical protein n=1 Tax=Snodgrassella alvi TaxID=1196083 RepID=UPI000C1E08E3|nr:hypothetical protein [Snodgrassella alvi]PIT41947.1 hypothetical protein BHC53_03300 [Snodgrassella alvi]